ncbi:Hypothetical protein CINCED_3A003667 [Cinara cedri]|uniref:Uncharacterized protein n=1 Tax=Cinara cedri TaxID=506608 RepID=A0A5E4LZN9_9HEMI|nr:Hypothetical protein CINCED_3A003667 [Cinara cedri]
MCHDDPRWYAAALEHFMAKSLISGISVADPTHQTVLLGKWYRTQDKETRERMNDARQYHGNDNNNQQPQWFYYPYKPAHISGHPAEYKRVYAVPDARVLFQGQTQFRMIVPPTKVRTVRYPDVATAITKTTVYKYKFVPLSRLHENNRIYGPILSSLPIVLSR